ncbi:diguanylate cyclase [Caenimonas sedimenti]|uniref:Diguanylate cyclase n=2 Tax=Caenimonas sedimenti TaxID=2596921 RepID=A0A562ZHU2_9BURK|nr:diguanylate cyclase [Caenimonas sedimenti]
MQMRAMELMIWSMSLGAIAAVAATRLADLAARPSLSLLRGATYHVIVFVFVLILSGVLAPTLRPDPHRLHVLQVLAGPLCVGLSTFWIRGWLGARQRDRLMSVGLRLSALALPLAAVAAFTLPRAQQLPAAAGLSLLGSGMMLWFAVRAWGMGDRLAPVMAAGCLLTLPAIAGLYAQAMHLHVGIAAQAVFAFCAALSNAFTGFVLWRRDRHEWKASREPGSSLLPLDPVTRVASGRAVVHRLIEALRRRQRTRRDGAVIAVLVFDVDRIAAQVGASGVHEMHIAIAGRIQRQVGVVNPVGRYWDRCFICLVETIDSPAWLRTLGLRVSSSLRRPIEVTGLGGERVEIRPDIGVGVVHLPPGRAEAEDVLHDAEHLAEAARGMRSRAAILNPATGYAVPVEQADLGPRGRPAKEIPHAALRRAAG